MKEFKDRVAVVTGAASGIGFALADRFAAVGMKVVLGDVEEPALRAAERHLRAKGAPVLAVLTDVSKAEQVETLAERAFSEFGGVHVVCNNAGVSTGGQIWDHALEDWHWVFGVNLWGVVHGIRSFVPRMLEQNTEGHLVNTASMAGLITSPYIGIYQATKHAVVALTEGLRMELEASNSQVSCSVLCPGFVQTGIADAERNRPKDLASTDDPALKAAQKSIREMARRQVAAGVRATEVAELTLEAIREDRFYVLTHARYEKLIRLRMNNILQSKNPKFDPV